MNKDIILLGNPSKLGSVVRDSNNEHIKSFISENGDKIIEYIKSCFTNSLNHENKRLEKRLYDFVEEYIHFYNSKIKINEICNDRCKNHTQHESAILHEAFMNLKQKSSKIGYGKF